MFSFFHRLKNIVLGISAEISFCLLVIAVGYLLGTAINFIR